MPPFRVFILACACAAFILFASIGNAGPQSRRIGVPQDVIKANRISGSDVLHVESAELAKRLGFSGIDIDLEVGPSGEIVDVRIEDDKEYQGIDLAGAIALVRTWRFRPILFNGEPITAVGSAELRVKGPEVWKDRNARFPPIDYEHLAITLERSACYGPCPDYRVEIKGTGEVVFTTEEEAVDGVAALHRSFQINGVLVPGRHVSRISRAELDRLIALFRSARFFGLKDSYRAQVTDSPSYVLTFRSGNSRKQVEDYVGSLVGMPAVVEFLEGEVDRAAGTERWTKGNASTGAALESEGFDFSSPLAQRMLVAAVSSEETVIDLVKRGIPLTALQGGTGQPTDILFENAVGVPVGQLLLKRAIQSGRSKVFAELQRLGWVDRMPIAELSLAFAEDGAGCSPTIARALIGAGVDPAARGRGGDTALMSALSSYSCREGTDLPTFVSTLIDLGVPLDPADKEGETAIYKARNLEVVKLLLRAGAKADVKNKKGLSPAFSSYDDRVVLTLLEAGADPSGQEYGNTLRQLTRVRKLPGTLAWLDAHQIP